MINHRSGLDSTLLYASELKRTLRHKLVREYFYFLTPHNGPR